jgi:hypothetical protein
LKRSLDSGSHGRRSAHHAATSHGNETRSLRTILW